MEELQKIVVKALIADGFDEIVDIKDRKYQLKVLGIVWLILVLIVPLFASGGILNFVQYVIILIISLLIEQVIHISISFLKPIILKKKIVQGFFCKFKIKCIL
jgi:hypothetical protein